MATPLVTVTLGDPTVVTVGNATMMFHTPSSAANAATRWQLDSLRWEPGSPERQQMVWFAEAAAKACQMMAERELS